MLKVDHSINGTVMIGFLLIGNIMVLGLRFFAMNLESRNQDRKTNNSILLRELHIVALVQKVLHIDYYPKIIYSILVALQFFAEMLLTHTMY